MISVAASAKIVEPVDDKRRWVFKTPQNDALMAGAHVGDARSLAMVDVAAEAKVPMISVAPAPRSSSRSTTSAWVFKTPQNDALMAGALADAMFQRSRRWDSSASPTPTATAGWT